MQVLNLSTSITFFLGLSPIVFLILVVESFYIFKLGFRKFALVLLLVALSLGIPTVMLTCLLSK